MLYFLYICIISKLINFQMRNETLEKNAPAKIARAFYMLFLIFQYFNHLSNVAQLLLIHLNAKYNSDSKT